MFPRKPRRNSLLRQHGQRAGHRVVVGDEQRVHTLCNDAPRGLLHLARGCDRHFLIGKAPRIQTGLCFFNDGLAVDLAFIVYKAVGPDAADEIFRDELKVVELSDYISSRKFICLEKYDISEE